LVRRTVADFRPDVLLSTGNSPLTAETLRAIATDSGVIRINYSTDDPWNRTMRANWFFRALPVYDWVFTPRRSNIADLLRVGVPRVEYVPFAYDPRSTHPVRVPPEVERPDILFVGGADRDRVPIIGRLIAEGFQVAVYGLNWQRFTPTRQVARGIADPDVIRQATAAAKISLCLVRRANRDGHVMRTFEAAAIGTCILADDTAEHRAILGNTATYFRGIGDLLDSARELLADDDRRARLAEAARIRIVEGRNTYRDRFDYMMGVAGLTQAPPAGPCPIRSK
jgi:spore maturation protein CgeB